MSRGELAYASVVRLIRAPVPLRSMRSSARQRLAQCSDSPGVSRLHCRSSRASIPGALRYAVRLETPGDLSGDRCCASGTPFAERHRLAPAANPSVIRETRETLGIRGTGLLLRRTRISDRDFVFPDTHVVMPALILQRASRSTNRHLAKHIPWRQAFDAPRARRTSPLQRCSRDRRPKAHPPLPTHAAPPKLP